MKVYIYIYFFKKKQYCRDKAEYLTKGKLLLRQSSTQPKYKDDKVNRNHIEAKQGRNKREEDSRHFD